MSDPLLDPSWVRGLDVSHDQGSVDWAQVAAAGCRFALVKATEGVTLTDPDFAANWAGAQAAGLLRGAYHFFHPDDDPTEQAEFFLGTVWPGGQAPAPGDLPPALDVEVTDGESSATIVQGITTWLAAVAQRTSRTPILYTNRGFWDGLGVGQLDGSPLWVAEYDVAAPTLPSGWPAWELWQYSQSGTISGIGVAVDLDVYQGDLQSLEQLAGLAASAQGTIFPGNAGVSPATT